MIKEMDDILKFDYDKVKKGKKIWKRLKDLKSISVRSIMIRVHIWSHHQLTVFQTF